MELWGRNGSFAEHPGEAPALLGTKGSRVMNTCCGECRHREDYFFYKGMFPVRRLTAVNHEEGLSTGDPEHALALLWTVSENLTNKVTNLLTLRLGVVASTFNPCTLEREAGRFL